MRLSPKALKLTRPKMDPMIQTREEYNDFASHVFDLRTKGAIKVRRGDCRCRLDPADRTQFYIHKTYPFTAEAVAQAQTDIASRGTTGKLVVEISKF